jgi:NADH:ubiquinone oxidoreductase subunit 6 (subunit J)
MLAASSLAIGLWLMLPRGLARGWMVGIALTTVGLGLLVSQLPGLGNWVASSLFSILAGITVASALATVTLRSPVYAAVWFGMTLLGTAGLFLFQGAQFLAVATIVVYAGAILVTFLFVLMLAQPQGRTHYDRVSWEALISATTGSVLVAVLAMTVTSKDAKRVMHLLFNAYWSALDFDLPPLPPCAAWRRLLDTNLAPPEDIYPRDEAPEIEANRYRAAPRSVVVFVADL